MPNEELKPVSESSLPIGDNLTNEQVESLKQHESDGMLREHKPEENSEASKVVYDTPAQDSSKEDFLPHNIPVKNPVEFDSRDMLIDSLENQVRQLQDFREKYHLLKKEMDRMFPKDQKYKFDENEGYTNVLNLAEGELLSACSINLNNSSVYIGAACKMLAGAPVETPQHARHEQLSGALHRLEKVIEMVNHCR